jgi:glycosyltransferase involved in cell wall biosynthesis
VREVARMTSNPLVTVITVFLNAERFIEEAIESVVAQSYHEWELVLIDDGSTDGSTGLALRYAKKHPEKVRYFEHPAHGNRGISASQNLGISRARGRYLAFLDADDWWASEKLEEQVGILESHPEAAMLYGRTQYWYSWTAESVDAARDLLIEPGVAPDSLVSPPNLLVRMLRQEIPVPCPSDVMVRRDAATDIGGFEESFRSIFTDQVFYAKLCLKWPVFVAGRTWFKYRKHSGSTVSVVKRSGEMQAARLRYLNWLQGYLDDREIEDQEVRRALKSARRRCLYPWFLRMAAHTRYRASTALELLRSIARHTLPASAVRILRRQGGNRAEEPR